MKQQILSMMLEDIHHQGERVAAELPVIEKQIADLEAKSPLADARRVFFVGCGDSYYAGMAARLAWAAADHLVGLGAYERIACEALAAFHALQQERVRLTSDLEVRRNRRFEVGNDFPVDRDEVAWPLSQLPERLDGWVVVRHRQLAFLSLLTPSCLRRLLGQQKKPVPGRDG